MKRGFSASTVILVALLLGVLFWVGKVVNPPIKSGHDEHDEHQEAPKQPSPSEKMTPVPGRPKPNMPPPQTSGGGINDNPREVIAPDKRGKMTPYKQPGTPPKPDDMDPLYFQSHGMGAAQTPKPDTKP